MIKLESVKTKNKKRIGRGISSGQGKTAGRGTKGQKSRSGFNLPNRFEGGQTALSMRLPKLPGFKSLRKKAAIVSLTQISTSFKDGDVVTLETLLAKELIKKGEKAKILNNGELTVKVSLGADVKASENIISMFVENLPTVKKETLPKKSETKLPEAEVEKVPAKAKATPKKTTTKKTDK